MGLGKLIYFREENLFGLQMYDTTKHLFYDRHKRYLHDKRESVEMMFTTISLIVTFRMLETKETMERLMFSAL